MKPCVLVLTVIDMIFPSIAHFLNYLLYFLGSLEKCTERNLCLQHEKSTQEYVGT